MMKSELIKKAEGIINKQILLKNDLTNYALILKDFKKELESNDKKHLRVKDLISKLENQKDSVERFDIRAREVARNSYKQMSELVNLTLTEEELRDEYESIEDFFVGIQRRVDEAVYEMADLKNLIKEIEEIEL